MSTPSGVPSGMDPVWTHRDELPAITPRAGITMRLLTGDNVQMNFVTLEPGTIVPLHQHANEQCGYVLEGTITLQIGEETRGLGPGQAYLIPSNTPHEGRSEHGCLVLDVFSPPRADYAESARAAARVAEE